MATTFKSTFLLIVYVHTYISNNLEYTLDKAKLQWFDFFSGSVSIRTLYFQILLYDLTVTHKLHLLNTDEDVRKFPERMLHTIE